MILFSRESGTKTWRWHPATEKGLQIAFYKHKFICIGRRFFGIRPTERCRCSPQTPRRGSMIGTPTGNKLIDGLPAQDIERLRPHLEAAPLVQKQTINAPGAPIEQIYFPISGVVSMIASLDDG